MCELRVEQIAYAYHDQNYILKNISLKIEKGESLGIIGLNGSGKTTLARILCGIIPHYFQGTLKGSVWINGKNTRELSLAECASSVGMVLQDPNIQLMMPTVEDELAFGLENHALERKKIKQRINEVIKFLNIEHIRHEKPHHLSGGQKQLVAIGAVLALDPAMIVFDESLSMLDKFAANNVLRVMEKLKEKGKGIILIDHTGKGIDIVDDVMVLEQGKILYKGDKETLRKEKTFLESHKIYL